MTRRMVSAPVTPAALREARGLTVGRLQRLADVDRKTVVRIEEGSQGVTSDSIEKVAAALTRARADLPPVTPEALFAAYQHVRRLAGSAA